MKRFVKEWLDMVEHSAASFMVVENDASMKVVKEALNQVEHSTALLTVVENDASMKRVVEEALYQVGGTQRCVIHGGGN